MGRLEESAQNDAPGEHAHTDLATLERLLEFGRNKIVRPSFMSTPEWRSINLLTDRLDRLVVALSLSGLEGLASYEDILLREGYRTSENATILLSQIRGRLTPITTDVEEGSILATVALASAPTLVAIVGAISARSAIVKNRSESRKANADAQKLEAERDLIGAQAVRIKAETGKLQAETFSILLDAAQRCIDTGILAEGEAGSIFVAKQIIDSMQEFNPAIRDPAVEDAVMAQVQRSFSGVAFLARHLRRAEGAIETSESSDASAPGQSNEDPDRA